MASKKVFTDLAFQGGAQLVNPMLHVNTGDPTVAGAGHVYYDGSANVNHLKVAVDNSTFKNIPHASVGQADNYFALDGYFHFSLADGTTPFTVTSTTVVANLNAAQVAGKVPNAAANAGDIPVYGTNGVLKVGTPVADDDAAPKVYVDTAVQGLEHKESVKYTTTGNITLENVTPAQSNLDIGTAIVEGDRVLVKNQTNASQNGIYIAKHNDDWERATDADYGIELVTNGTDFTGGPPPTGWTETAPADLTVDDGGGSNWRLKVANTSAGSHGDARQSFAVEVGKSYKVTVTAEIGTASDYQIKIGSTNAGQDYFYEEVTADATKVVVFTARTALLSIRLQNSGGASTHCFFDNISAKEADLNEGAFVFVEEGDTKPNTSWVMSATNVWTQFSGAGQITAGDGLAKLGDTLSVDLAASTPLEFTSNKLSMAAIDTGDLADDAVDADKLDGSASFTMAGLTVNGSIGLNTSSPSHAFQTDVANGNANFIGIRQASQILWSTGLKASDTNLYFRSGNAGVEVDHVTFGIDGQVGIGADATSPSGTLHVSTARYGSEEVTDGTFPNFNNWSQTPSSAWSVANNTASCDGTQSSWANLTQTSVFTANRKYRLKVEVTVSSGNIQIWANGSQSLISGISSTQNIDQVVSPTVTGTIQFECSSGFIGTFKNLSVTEDNLAAGVDSDGDDLVVSGKDETGISIISQANTDAGIYFGDGLSDGFSKILSKRALDGTGTLKLDVNSSTALEIDSSQNVKIPNGGLGVGRTPTASGAYIGGTAESAIERSSTAAGSAVLYVGKTGTTGNQVFARFFHGGTAGTVASGTEAISLAKDTSWFLGNLAIGATASTPRLTVHDAAEHCAIHITTGGTNKNVDLKLTPTGTGSAFIDYGIGAGSDILFYSRKTNVGNVLAIDGDGTQDHKANSIVNSSTVQGLQDGACYDFDGTDDYISTPLSLPTVDFTVASWVKFDSASTAGEYWFDTRDASNTSGWLVWSDYVSSGKRRLQVYAGGVQFNTDYVVDLGVWQHLCLVKNGSTITLYQNGVQIGTAGSQANPTNGATFYLGTRYSVALFFTGQMRDTKILSSQLDAGDVRKLYSGENPKKNLNVELVTNGTFDSNTTGWTAGSNASTITASAGKATLELLNGSISDYPKARTSLGTLTDGKTYLLKVGNYTRKSGNALRIKINNNGNVAVAQPSGTLLYNSTTSIVDGYYYFTPTDTEEHFLWMYMQDAAGTSEAEIDNLSVTEVGTLVDFNPRSASTTKWYNQAIPSLYNGTLAGGVTLSAGSTDHKVNGGFTLYNSGIAGNTQLHIHNDKSGDAAVLLLEGGRTSNNDSGQVLFSNNGNLGSCIKGFSAGDDGQLRFYTSATGTSSTLTEAGRIEPGGDWFIASGKQLGVGLSPTEIIHAKGANPILRIESEGTGGSAQDITLMLRSIQDGWGEIKFHPTAAGSGRWMSFSAKNAVGGQMFLTQPGNLGIGMNDPSSKLAVRGDIELSDSGYANIYQLKATAYSGGGRYPIGAIKFDEKGNYNGEIQFWTTPKSANASTATSTHAQRMVVDRDGFVGISTTTPQGRLDVKGSIRGEADSYTKLLIHSDTTDGSTTFVDSSPSGHAITAVADTKHKTAQYKFGATSMYFDGTGDYLSAPDHDDINNFGTGSYTIDFWFKTSSTQQYTSFYSTEGTSSGFTLLINIGNATDGKIAYWGGMGSDVRTSSGGFNDNNWHHVAFVRSGTAASIYVDGVSLVTATSSAAETGSSNIFRIGNSYFGNRDLTGYMDEFRISKGVARWTSSFTPPTRPYATVNDEYFADQDKISTLGFGTPLLREGALDGVCYDFDGTNDYISVGTSLWSANGDRTFSVWLKADDFATQHNIFHTEGGSGDFMIHTDGTIRIHPVSANWQNTTNAISTGVWYHIVFTQTSSARKIYVDGVEQTLATATGSPQTAAWSSPATELRIGEEGYRDFFDGQIRDVKILPSALNSGEVAQLYNGYNPKKLDTALTFTWSNYASGNDTFTTSGTNLISIINASGTGYSRAGTLGMVSGKTYKITVDYTLNSGAGASCFNDGAGDTAGPHDFGLTLTSSDTYTAVFTYGGSDDYIWFQTSGATNWSANVTVALVGTLVDFNSRSASPATWHNSAIPALYNGTVNGASMSAGSTDHKIGGTLDVDGELTGTTGTFSDLITSKDLTINGAITVGSTYIYQNYIRAANIRVTDNAYLGSQSVPSVIQIQGDGDVAIGYPLSGTSGTFSGNIATTGTGTITSASSLTAGGSLYVDENIRHTGDTNNYHNFTTDTQTFFTDGIAALTIDSEQNLRAKADSDTVLLIHSDTTDGATTFVDSSPSGRTVTAGGGADHATAQKKFGSSSIELDGDDGDLTVASTSDFAFPGDFTVDVWIRRTSPSTSYPYIFDFRPTGSEPWPALYLHSGDSYKLQYHVNAAVRITGGAISTNTWYHIALVRSGSTTTLYLDGVSQGTWTDSTSFAASPLRIGGYSNSNGYGFSGYLDEFRISKGVARWSSDFTPPARPYSTVNDEFFNDLAGISKTGIDLVEDGGTVDGRPLLNLVSTADHDNGAAMVFKKTHADESDNDILGTIKFNGQNTNQDDTAYAEIYGQSVDVSYGTEDGVLRLRTMSAGTLGSRLTVSSADTKVHGKLGVGGDPDASYQLAAFATSQNVAVFSSTHASYGRAVINAATADADTLLSFQSGGSSKWSIGNNSGDSHKFQIRTSTGGLGGSATKFTLDTSGNVGIGETAPQGELHIDGSNPELWLTHSADDAGSCFLRFGHRATPSGGYIKTAIVSDSATGLDFGRSNLHFLLDSVQDSGNAVLADSVLTLNNDGTHNHQANRIVNSQTVSDLNRTAEPSLRFDGDGDKVTIPFSSSLNFGTGDFTLEAWVKGAAAGLSEYRAIYVRGATANIDWITNTGTGVSRLWLGNRQSNGTTNILDDKWHHVVVVRDGDTVAHYVDGVVEPLTVVTGATVGDLADTGYAALDHTHVSSSGTVGISGSNYDWDGEIRGFSLHNRALADTEVAAAYNGESTPWKYAGPVNVNPTYPLATGSGGAGEELVSNGDMSSSTNWAFLNSSTISGGVATVNAKGNIGSTTSNHVLKQVVSMFETGRSYRVSFKVKQTTGSGNFQMGNGYQAHFNQSVTSSFVTHSFVANPTSWTNVHHEFLAFGGGTDGDVFVLDDVSVKLIGEVAAYTPQSIGATTVNKAFWADTTSNNNSGVITGATRVNPLVHGGLVLGDSDYHSNSQHTKLSAIVRDTVSGTDDGGVVICGGGGHGAGRGGNITLYGNEHTRASEIRLIGDTQTHFVGTDDKLEITAGAVKAASTASSNLKQVARVFNTGSSPITGDGSRTHFNVLHNLGTDYCTVSIREETTGQLVECDVRVGKSWSDSTSVYQTSAEYVVVTFATAPANGVEYGVTVIG
jgi:hypothetical protein